MEFLFLLVSEMKTIEKSINQILADWNPLDVPPNIAETEYVVFIPSIRSKMNDEKELLMYLEALLTNELELDYNSANSLQNAEAKDVARKIIKLTI